VSEIILHAVSSSIPPMILMFMCVVSTLPVVTVNTITHSKLVVFCLELAGQEFPLKSCTNRFMGQKSKLEGQNCFCNKLVTNTAYL
jgi:hypothetical protein